MSGTEAMPETGLSTLVERVSRRTGLDLAGCHQDRMIDAIVQTAQVVGARTFGELGRVLECKPDVYGELVDRLRVGETYFFREPGQFELLRSMARSRSASLRGPQGLRIWSAGCASGEEPYTVAIVLDDEGVLDRSTILGTDISPIALHRARRATYGEWSLRRCEAWQRERYFEQVGTGAFTLRRRYADAVELRAHNVIEGPPEAGEFDLVICRNVLIYLTEDAIGAAVDAFHRSLAPGGWLILGPSDPLAGHTGLERVPTPHGAVYRRPSETAPQPHLIAPGQVGAIPARSGPHPGSIPERRSPRARSHLGRGCREGNQARSTPGAASGKAAAEVVRGLGGKGALQEAIAAVHAAIADDPLDPELRYLAATIHLNADHPAEAVAAAAAAVYLDPSLAPAHLLLGQAQQRCGDPDGARRSFRNAHELLALLPKDAGVRLADGEPAGQLAAAAGRLAGR